MYYYLFGDRTTSDFNLFKIDAGNAVAPTTFEFAIDLSTTFSSSEWRQGSLEIKTSGTLILITSDINGGATEVMRLLEVNEDKTYGASIEYDI